MDELNNLKKAWKEFSNVNAQKQYSSEELNKIVRKRSKNELLKIKRKLFFESGLGIFLSIILVIMVGLINPSDTFYAFLFILTILAVSFIPYIKVFRLGLTQKSNLKSHLSQFISSFENLIAQYIRLSTVLIPVAGLGGFLLGLHATLTTEEWFAFFTLINISIIVIVLIAISLLGQVLLRRYFKWIYGKNIQRLSGCLAELEITEEPDYE